MGSKVLGSVAFVVDDRLSREKSALLTRIVNGLRASTRIDLLRGSITEEKLLEKLQQQNYQLVLAPWYRYMAWTKVEAFYGLTRTSGPTFAGYFCEQLLPYELGEKTGSLRTILLDFNACLPSEVALIIKTLIQDHERTGILPLLGPSAPIYWENWRAAQGLGNRIDAILSLPELAGSEYLKRANALRISLCALWSMIYEHGPGKSELLGGGAPSARKAHFQVGISENLLALRLCYTFPNSTPKDLVAAFWPDSKDPSNPAQLLLRYSDFVKAHLVADTSDIEIVAGFLKSAPGGKNAEQVHTIWVEPIAKNLFNELPETAPDASQSQFKQLVTQTYERKEPVPNGDKEISDKAKDRFIFDAAAKIRELRHMLSQKEELMRELRSGGVGINHQISPPDAEALLEAFQERYFDARLQIRRFEMKITELETRRADAREIEALRQKIASLAQRESGWIKKIAKILETFRETSILQAKQKASNEV